MKNQKSTILLLVISFVLFGCTQSGEWYQYLGPERNATVKDAYILRSWNEESPRELWSADLGPGYGSASIFDDEVFILDRKKGEADMLRCFDFNNGEEKWKFEYEAVGELPFPGSRAVPTVDKKHVWTVGPHGDLYCINKKSRQAEWHLNLKEKYEAEPSQWGFSQSPLLYKDMVIVSPHGKKAGIVAFKKNTGTVVWESRPLTGSSFHVSPTLAKFGGIDQVIMISPYDRRDSTRLHEVVSFNAQTGEELWTYDGLRSFATISPAVTIEDNMLFLTDCSYNDNYAPVSILLEIEMQDDNFEINERFKTEEAGCKMHPGIYYDEHIYLNSNGNPNKMSCLDMKGNDVWSKDSVPGFEMGAMILINDLIINQNGKNGDIHLIEPTLEGYKELGRASFFESNKSQAWAPIAYSNGRIIIRNLEKMVCVDLR
ncbi:PQQ-binding-like beta-propeller repeat protein [Bacteroidota bacterium]